MADGVNAIIALATHVAEAKQKPIALHIKRRSVIKVRVFDTDDEANACVTAWSSAAAGMDEVAADNEYCAILAVAPHTLWFIAANNIRAIGQYATVDEANEAAAKLYVSTWGIGPSQADPLCTYTIAHSPSEAAIQAIRRSAGSTQ